MNDLRIKSEIEKTSDLIEAIKVKDPLKKDKVKQIILSLSDMDKKSLWKFTINNKVQLKNNDVIFSLIKSEPYYESNTLAFFNDYVVKSSDSSKRLEPIYYFVKINDNKWLLEESSIFLFIYKQTISSITSSFNKNKIHRIKTALLKRISSLNEDEYNLFLEMYVTHSKEKENLIKFIFEYGSYKQVNKLKDLYFDSLSEDFKKDLGIVLLLKKDMVLINDNIEIVVDAINKKIRNKTFCNNLSKVMQPDFWCLIYSIYDRLEDQHRSVFLNNLLVMALSENGKYETIDTILGLKKENSNQFPVNTSVFLLWKAVSNFPKKEKDLYVEKILNHTKEIGEYKDIRKFLINRNEEVIFNGKTIKSNNQHFAQYFNFFLYTDLQETLEVKPANKKHKI